MEGSVGSQPAAHKAVGSGVNQRPPSVCVSLQQQDHGGLSIRRTQGVLASCVCAEVWTSSRGLGAHLSMCQKLGRPGPGGQLRGSLHA